MIVCVIIIFFPLLQLDNALYPSCLAFPIFFLCYLFVYMSMFWVFVFGVPCSFDTGL